MRYISKRANGSYYLEKANENPPETDTASTSRWSSFQYKSEVQQFLLSEQYQLCCYSEIRADEYQLGYHIEHIENKSQNPTRTFDYTNLAASAFHSDSLKPFKDSQRKLGLPEEVFGGHASGKQHSVDMTLFVSPQDEICTRFFAYLSDGRIVPAYNLDTHDKNRADYTINLLNLNSPFLLLERQKWWNELDQFLDEHLNDDMDVRLLASIDLIPGNEKLSRFFSLTRQFFGDIAEGVLQNDAPELL